MNVTVSSCTVALTALDPGSVYLSFMEDRRHPDLKVAFI
jgi:hypothetical protein